MKQHIFTPRWKDRDGNVIIIPAPAMLYEERLDAADRGITLQSKMEVIGYAYDGVAEFTKTRQTLNIPCVPFEHRAIGTCALIEGPLYTTQKALLRAKRGRKAKG